MRISYTLIIIYSLMAFIIAVFGAPFIWMFVTSIKPDEEIVRYPIEWIPDNPTFEAYYRLFGKYPIMRWFFNSILIATITTLITIVTNLLAAYPLSKMRFKGKNIFLLMILSTFLLPGELLLVPLFLGLSEFQITDSYFSLSVPAAANAFGIFLLMQFFKRLPYELDEAARVDGCSRLEILTKIYLPLSKPAIATVAIFTFVRSWNEFFWPLIVCNSDETRTITVGIATFVSRGLSSSFGILMSSAFVASVPAILFFLLFQRYFVVGISTTGIK